MEIRQALIIANYQKTEARPLAMEISAYLRDRGIATEIFSFSGKADLVFSRDFDLAITLGGDGTVLFAARALAPKGIPILPVNLGNFGFITEVSKDDWYKDLASLLEGKMNLGSRLMLKYSLSRKDEDGVFQTIAQGNALNDVVVSGSGISKIINLMVHLDEAEHIEYKADGIIFSTPTGSTAYSAAAGGPILHPEIEALILNPICPFTLSHRPLVLPASARLTVEVLPRQRTELTLTVDGQLSHALEPGDRICICRSESMARILYSGSRSFYEVLRAKLNWAGGPE